MRMGRCVQAAQTVQRLLRLLRLFRLFSLAMLFRLLRLVAACVGARRQSGNPASQMAHFEMSFTFAFSAHLHIWIRIYAENIKYIFSRNYPS